MTNSEKATQVLDYLEELDSRSAINALSPLIDDDDLADLYDKLEKDGILRPIAQTAKLIAIFDSSDDFWEQLADDYQYFDFESFVSRVKNHPDALRDCEAEEIEGEIQNENERYILTWEDGMNEVVRIYEK